MTFFSSNPRICTTGIFLYYRYMGAWGSSKEHGLSLTPYYLSLIPLRQLLFHFRECGDELVQVFLIKHDGCLLSVAGLFGDLEKLAVSRLL